MDPVDVSALYDDYVVVSLSKVLADDPPQGIANHAV